MIGKRAETDKLAVWSLTICKVWKMIWRVQCMCLKSSNDILPSPDMYHCSWKNSILHDLSSSSMDINSWKMVTDIWSRYSTKWDTNQTLNLLNSSLGGMPMNDSARMTKPQVRDSRWYHVLSMLRTKVWYFITTYMYFIFENYLNKVFLTCFCYKKSLCREKIFFCLKKVSASLLLCMHLAIFSPSGVGIN